MAEYLHGAACHYCGEILTLRVSVEDVRDDEGVWVEVSVEVDMDPWWTHIDAHRKVGDGACTESLLHARMPGAH